MSKISAYPLRTLVSGDVFVVAVGGRNYRVKFDNLIPKGHIHGLTLSNNVADATNDIDVAIGEAKDTANSAVMSLASALTKRLDATFVAGTNQGMRSSSVALANTTYHIFLMRVGGSDDIGADTSATGANLVTDHGATNLRRIGSIVRSSGAIKGFIQDGDRFMWKSPVSDISVTNPGTAAVTRTLTLPTGIRVEAIIGIASSGTTNTDNPGSVYISDLALDDVDVTIVAVGTFSFYSYNGAAVLSQLGAMCRVFTNTSAQVRSRVQISTAGTQIYINTHGWIDTRGRLA